MQPEDKLKHYHDLLLQWQKTINLVSPTTLNDAWNRHFEDSIQLMDYIGDNVKSICDIGSGAGFPGLVMGIMNPDINIYMIESDARKCAFLKTVSRETLCDNVTVYNDRIEDKIDEVTVDMVTCRALASIRQLLVYTKPLWGDNFKILMPKGKNWHDEIADAQKKFTFDVQDYPSKTDKDARILIVGNIAEK